MELCDNHRVLVWEAQRNFYRGKHLAQTGMVLFFLKHSSSSRNPKSVSQKVGGNHWNEPVFLTDLPLTRPPAQMLPQPGRSETRRDGGHVGFSHVKLTEVYQNCIEVPKRNKFPKVQLLPFKNQHQVTKNGWYFHTTGYPSVYGTLQIFCSTFRAPHLIVIFRFRLSLRSGRHIAEASSVHVKDEDVENNQCDTKKWCLNILVEKTLKNKFK